MDRKYFISFESTSSFNQTGIDTKSDVNYSRNGDKSTIKISYHHQNVVSSRHKNLIIYI